MNIELTKEDRNGDQTYKNVDSSELPFNYGEDCDEGDLRSATITHENKLIGYFSGIENVKVWETRNGDSEMDGDTYEYTVEILDQSNDLLKLIDPILRRDSTGLPVSSQWALAALMAAVLSAALLVSARRAVARPRT